MIGPSSSHTAGAVRLGKIARKILDDIPVKAHIQLSGSFARTYKGHGTDKAIVAGIMDWPTYDERIRNSLQIASESGLDYSFTIQDIPDTHPNTARITLTGKSGKISTMQGCSIGGGNILVTEINGTSVSFSGEYNTLIILHHDKPGTIAAVTKVAAESGLNIGNFRLSRPQRGADAVMTIEVDEDVPDKLMDELKLVQNVVNVVLIRRI